MRLRLKIFIFSFFALVFSLSAQPVSFVEKCDNQVEGCKIDSFNVYYVTSPENGVNFIEWENEPHDNPSNIWTGLPSQQSGLPSHYSAISTDSGITNDWNYSTSANHLEAWSWVRNVGLGDIIIRDNNANTGERLLPYYGSCANPIALDEITVDTPAADRSYGEFGLVIPDSTCFFIGWHASDLSANQGVDIEYTTDLTGVSGWTNLPASITYTEKPKVECKRVACGYVLQEGESKTKIELCDPIFPAISMGTDSSEDVADLQNQIQDLQDQINNISSTDDQELRYDPVTKRIFIEDGNFADLTVMPAWTTLTAPVLVGAGTFTSNLSQTLETDTRWYTQRDGDCREHYRFTFSIRGDHAAGTGWGYVDVPQPAGWDRDIYYVGTYNYSGNPNNPNDPVRGAMPDAPNMSQDAHNYRNGARVYIGQLNDRDNLSRYWVDIKANFLRN